MSNTNWRDILTDDGHTISNARDDLYHPSWLYLSRLLFLRRCHFCSHTVEEHDAWNDCPDPVDQDAEVHKEKVERRKRWVAFSDSHRVHVQTAGQHVRHDKENGAISRHCQHNHREHRRDQSHAMVSLARGHYASHATTATSTQPAKARTQEN